MVPSDSTISSLRSIVGATHVLTDPDLVVGHVTDWTGRFVGATPAVVRPGSLAEVASVVDVCRSAGVAMVPQGGNTGLVGGSVPMQGEIVVSTTRLDEIDDVDIDAGQLTAGAGATLAAVQDAAHAVGWRYGVDLAARNTATVGGTIATNAGGLRVIRFGTTRRQVLGVEAVLGSGVVVRRLDGLVKDNTGYDLAGLLCGSEGSLGIVTRARLSLVPAAGETVTALVGLDSVAAAVRLAGDLRRSVPGLEAVEVVFADGAALVAEQTGTTPVFDPLSPVQVLVEAVGPPDPASTLDSVLGRAGGVTEVAVATDGARSARLWHVREAHTEAISRVGIPIKYDVTVPMRRLADFCTEVPLQLAEALPGSTTVLFGHLADGNIHVSVLAEDRDASVSDAVVLPAVIERGGSISAEHGVGRAKRGWLARDRSAGDLAAMRAVKSALDPNGVCNPNVLFAPD